MEEVLNKNPNTYACLKLGEYMDIDKLKKNIETTKTVEKLMRIGEKIFIKNDDAVCAVTYLIERAYILGKQNNEKLP